VKVVENKDNLGFGVANNQAMKLAKGRYFFLLNPDAYITKNTVELLSDFMEKHKDAGLVGPRLLNFDGTHQPSGRKFPRFFVELIAASPLMKIFPKTITRYLIFGRDTFNEDTMVDEVSGAAMFVRREVFKQTGGFDEDLLLYFEDVDWCKRIRKAGWEIYQCHEPVVYHFWEGTGKKSAFTRGVYQVSRYKYFLKHHGNFQALLLRTILGVYYLATFVVLSLVFFNKQAAAYREKASLMIKANLFGHI
jgi:GT2 family glycosyltransferase